MADIVLGHKLEFSGMTMCLTLVFLVFMSIIFLIEQPCLKYDIQTLFFGTIFLYYISIILVNEIYIYYSYYIYDKNALRNILVSISLILASRKSLYTRFFLSKITIIKIIYIVMVLLPSICATMLTNANSATFFIRSLSLTEDMGVSYQTYGDIIVIFYSILLINITSKQQILVLFFITLFGLLTLGSKAGFIGFFISNIFLFLIYLLRRNLVYLVTGVSLFLLLYFLIGPIAAIYSEKLPGRQYSWIFNMAIEKTQERSFATRKLIDEYNAKTRLDRFLLGNYKHEIYEGLGKGTYSHNLYDLIDQMGIGFFCIYVIFMLYNLIISIYNYLKGKNDLLAGNLILLFYWFILFIFVRSSGTFLLMYILYLSMLNLKKFITKGEDPLITLCFSQK